MLFYLGRLHVMPDEKIIIGDPAYIPESMDLVISYNQPWIKMGSKSDIMFQIEEFLEKKKINIYVDMQIDEYSSLPRPAAFLILYSNGRDAKMPAVRSITKENYIGSVGVDSGQVSFIADSVVPTWTRENADGSRGMLQETVENDYAACADVTLNYQLSAGAHPRHTTFMNTGFIDAPVATVFSSQTFDGDGVYSVYEMRETFDGETKVTGIVVDFTGLYDNEEHP